MEGRKDKGEAWISVPQFGDWEMKGEMPNYSMDFSKIREMRKQNKKDPSRASLGNEEELIAPNTASSTSIRNRNTPHTYHGSHAPSARRSIFGFFSCCAKA